MFAVSVSTTAAHWPPRSLYSVCAERETFAECEAWARSYFTIAELSPDADYPGCADFLTVNGVVGKIEPVGFKLAAD